uniref:MO25-like protein At5g47540 n=1 Tax=Nicotiana sylvestris TaxID=4096 RepID=A0A1U7VZ04_NICSY|nr:PREDICTED: putative MO25-like protein At5g47540 [Nicotiana sylvestris]
MAMMELSKSIRELKIILYGNGKSEPLAEACAQLTQEFSRENTLRLIITCLPNLNLETRKDATQVVANLQRQQVQSRLIACDYLEANIDLMDILILGEATLHQCGTRNVYLGNAYNEEAGELVEQQCKRTTAITDK